MPVCPKCRLTNPKVGQKCPRDGYYSIPESALKRAPKDARLGTMLAGKYIIVSPIGQGGMGEVYLALQHIVGRKVAIKILQAGIVHTPEIRARFIREAQAIAKLSHPNIVTLFDFGLDDTSHPFMAMEYVRGISLAQWARQPDLTFSRIEHVYEQFLTALSEAHRNGVVHRDLKPGNVMITRTSDASDFVKLIDFGIARQLHDSAAHSFTQDGQVFGTPHYMAPEQASGVAASINEACDVYAAGVLLYELVCGVTPFNATTPLAVLYKQVHEALPPIVPRAGIEIPEGLRDIIVRATRKNPQHRFKDACEMLRAFQQASGPSGIATASTRLMTPDASSALGELEAWPQPRPLPDSRRATVPEQTLMASAHLGQPERSPPDGFRHPNAAPSDESGTARFQGVRTPAPTPEQTLMASAAYAGASEAQSWALQQPPPDRVVVYETPEQIAARVTTGGQFITHQTASELGFQPPPYENPEMKRKFIIGAILILFLGISLAIFLRLPPPVVDAPPAAAAPEAALNAPAAPSPVPTEQPTPQTPSPSNN